MKIFLLAVFAVYLAIDMTAAFVKWFHAKNNKEYWHGFADVVLTAAVMFGFVKLLEVL